MRIRGEGRGEARRDDASHPGASPHNEKDEKGRIPPAFLALLFYLSFWYPTLRARALCHMPAGGAVIGPTEAVQHQLSATSHLLNLIRQAAVSRDAHVRTARQVIDDPVQSGDRDIDAMRDAAASQLDRHLGVAGNVAASLRQSAQLAETSNRRVKAIDAMLRRVTKCLDLTKALRAQHAATAAIDGHIAEGRLDAAAAMIKQYDDSADRLRRYKQLRNELFSPAAAAGVASSRRIHEEAGGADGTGGTNAGDAARADDPPHHSELVSPQGGTASSAAEGGHGGAAMEEDAIVGARLQLRDSVRLELEAACAANNHKDVENLATTLARLSFVHEASAVYVQWRCRTACAELDSMLATELRATTAAGPAAASSSSLSPTSSNRAAEPSPQPAQQADHLNLVSRVLDYIASHIERSEGFMTAAFGSVAPLVDALHEEATPHCVAVIDHFLARQQVSTTTTQGKSSTDPLSFLPVSKRRDARVIDQLLQDISHQLSCCAVYNAFIASKCSDPVRAARTGVLSTKLAQLLTIYVPLQGEYFRVAFDVGLNRFDEATLSRLKSVKAQLAATGAADVAASGLESSGKSIMSTLTSLYTGGSSSASTVPAVSPSSMGSSDPRGATKELASLPDGDAYLVAQLRDLPVTEFLDDVFYVLRVAIHRMLATKDIAVASSAFITAIDALRDRLVPEIQSRLRGLYAQQPSSQPSTAQAVINPATMAWLRAAGIASDYVERLHAEFTQLSAQMFRGKDLIRLQEQSSDLLAVSSQMFQPIVQTSAQRCAAVVHQLLSDGFSAFVATNHIIARIGGSGAGSGATGMGGRAASQGAPQSDDGADGLVVPGSSEDVDRRYNSALETSWVHTALPQWQGIIRATVFDLLRPSAPVVATHSSGGRATTKRNASSSSGGPPRTLDATAAMLFGGGGGGSDAVALPAAVQAIQDDIIAALAGRVATTFEQAIQRKAKQVDTFGALVIGNDVRLVRSFFESLTDRPVRDKFHRLVLIVTVLESESLESAMAEASARSSSLGTSHGAGSLSEAQIRKLFDMKV